MIKIRDFRWEKNLLCDYLPWACLVEPGTMLNKDGSLMKVFRYRGPDMDSRTDAEMMAYVSEINNIVRRLSGNWAIFLEAKRSKSTEYPDREYPDPITTLMDIERKNFFNSGNHYESKYYFTLYYLPPADKYDKLEKVFYTSAEKASEREHDRIEEHLRTFRTEANRIHSLLAEIMPECEALDDGELLTYLHSCVSTKDHKIHAPEIPMYLDAILYDSPLTGGLYPALGTQYDKKSLSVISVIGFPAMTMPGILDDLNRLGIEYRWCTRYIPLDKVDAENTIKKIRLGWFRGRKTLWTMLKETITKSESQMIETPNLDRADDADAALLELSNEYCNFGYFCTTVILMNEDQTILDNQTRLVEKTIQSRGFSTRREDLNAVGAWMSSIPGMVYANIRWPMINSLNLAHILPVSAVWAGNSWNKHLNAPPIMHTMTTGSTPFRLNLHVGDVGNTMIVGPIGSGKSVLLNTLEAQFRFLKNCKIFIFDKGGSSRVLTAGVGGEFYDLGSETETNSLSFQPLRHIDQEDEKIWASEWLMQIFAQENVVLTPKHKSDIWSALNSLAAAPENERTMTGFFMFCQNLELRAAIMPFIKKSSNLSDGGPYGRLFDSDEDTLTVGSWQSFEMGELMNKPTAVLPTLQYLFHVIERHCDGSPTIIVLDECWVFLDNPLFAEKIREWFKTMRKNNVWIIFATQNLTDVAKSKIAPAIIESCFTRIFLPNANAINNSDIEIYKMFNINERERQLIAMAMPKRQYYYKSTEGCRLFELALSDFMLSYVGSASKEDQAKCNEILQTFGKGQFNEHWLEYKNQKEALEAYKQIVT